MSGLLLKDDPFDPARFSDNMGLWPQVEYGNIFKYFIEQPGVYTEEQFSFILESYNYFRNAHVRTVYCTTSQVNPFVFLKHL